TPTRTSSTPPSTCLQTAHTAPPSSPAHSPTLPVTTTSPSKTLTSPPSASTATGKASSDPRPPHRPGRSRDLRRHRVRGRVRHRRLARHGRRQPDQNHHAHVRPRRTRNRRRRHLGRRLQRRIQGLENLGRNRRHPKPLHPGDPLSNRLKNIAPKVAKNVTAKIVTLDIERIPGRASVKHRGLTIKSEFWDLNGWKHTIGRRIHADDVLEWPRTICAAWRWYGEDEVHFAAEWEVGGNQEFMRKLWDVYSGADVTVGHNMQSFDG